MNYGEYLKHTYIISDENGGTNYSIVLMEDGDYHIISDSTINNYHIVFDYLANITSYVRLNYNRNISAVIRKNAYENWLFVTNRNDFVILKAINNNPISNGKALQTQDVNTQSYYDDGVSVSYSDLGLSYGTNYNDFYEASYDEYTFALASNHNALFDYNNLEAVDYVTIRGENVTYYNQYLYWNNNDDSELQAQISVGNYVQRIYNNGYQAGYGNGSASGYVNGYDAGYQAGSHSQPVEVQEATAFSYIGNAFQVVSNVLSLEVLPHVTLGLVFSIPLVFVLIMTIFKLVRK